MDSRILVRAAGLAAAALLGAAIALGGAAVMDVGRTATVREVVESRSTASPTFKGGELSINDIYLESAPGVVQVTSTAVVESEPDPFFGNPFAPGSQTQRSLGSGFVIDKAGHIVTNFHVVEGAQSVEVSFSNQETMRARILGVDPATDIAVLKVDARSRALTPLKLGDSDTVEVGDSVVAIGNPFGLERSITAGIVSALQRQIVAPNRFSAIDHVIQTDAPINSGNSGGPLLDDQAHVIGVNTAISTAAGNAGNVGIGFAVPSNTVKEVVAQLIDTGKVDRAFIGIGGTTITPELARVFRLPVDTGVLIERVGEGTAGDRAGLKSGTTETVVEGQSYTLGGDVIVAADGKRVASIEDLRDILAKHKPGDEIELEIYRGTSKRTVEIELGRQPATPSG